MHTRKRGGGHQAAALDELSELLPSTDTAMNEHHILDEEQFMLANVNGITEVHSNGRVSAVDLTDSNIIQTYVKACGPDETVKNIDIFKWYKTCFHDFVAWLIEQQELEEAESKNSMDQ